MENTAKPLKKIAFFGAAPDSGNQGVTALSEATLQALAARGVRNISQFGFRGGRDRNIRAGAGELRVRQLVARPTRKLYRVDSLFALSLGTRFRVRTHAASRAVIDADAVLDISAGDSFSDIYGLKRFEDVMAPKRAALAAGVPLILLPQTIGPFRSKYAAKQARKVLLRAKQVWTRDADSHEALKELLQADFDEAKHRQGVDMAFLLQPLQPENISRRVEQWLSDSLNGKSGFIGVNVSGLIYNTPNESRRQFELAADYRVVLSHFITETLSKSDSRILLVPHVLVPNARESDFDACEHLKSHFPQHYQDRIEILPPSYNASELKWIIGQTRFFCGTRMHSTIAGLSSGVPTACLSYSMKTRGVFASCGMSKHAIELRANTSEEVLARLLQSWNERKAIQQELQRWLPGVIKKANHQVDEIVFGSSAAGQSAVSSTSNSAYKA